MISNLEWVCFWWEKTDGDVRISQILNLDPFCDVTDPQNGPKWSENHKKGQIDNIDRNNAF